MTRAPLPRILLDARKARDWGIGTYIRTLLGGLVRTGDWKIVALARDADASLIPPGVRVVACEAPHYSLRELFAVRDVVTREAPDLFHAPHYVVPLFPPRRSVVTIHDLMHLTRPEHAGPAKRAYARFMLGRAVRSAARILVDSRAVADELAARFPAAAPKTRVVPPAVAPEFLTPVSRPHGAPYVLFVGNPKPHKNVEGLLTAFRLSGLPRLVLAGGERREERDGVVALGFVPDAELPALLAGAEMLVLPSFAEGFGLPALEAQAVGTPVVCSDIPALREATGGHALFADPHDPESFARAMRGLHTDTALHADLAARGRANAALHTADRLAERTAAVYREVLAS